MDPRPSPFSVRGAPPRVLMVLADDGLREVLGDELASLGFSVSEAGGGHEALDELARADGSLELVIADLRLPGMSGQELIRRIHERWPALRVVCLSGRSRGSDDDAALDPATTLLHKPFSVDELEQHLVRVLSTPVQPLHH